MLNKFVVFIKMNKKKNKLKKVKKFFYDEIKKNKILLNNYYL